MMVFEEIQAKHAIDLSPHNHAFLNPYNGCLMGCPYCYWLSIPGWENRIQVKKNIAELLKDYLRSKEDNDYLYLGSMCDPFMEQERVYGLTKACLELIDKYRVPLVIMTSAASDVILDYIDILKSMEQKVIVVVELSRIPFIEKMNHGGKHTGIIHANILQESGIKTWATLAPILPGITKLDYVLADLNAKIPLYIDRLYCNEDDLQSKRILEWISSNYPKLYTQYRNMIIEQDWRYFESILQQNSSNTRIKTFPFQLQDELV